MSENSKYALITGASSGIGYETSLLLLQNGYKVIGIGRNFDNSEALISNPDFTHIICDLCDTAQLIKLVNNIKKQCSVSLLINNAGVGYFGPHECLKPEAIHEMVCTNLEVPMLLCNLLLRDLENNCGTIINVSSVTAKKSNTHGCAYGATKAALTSFSQSLFDEIRKHDVRVITVHPDMTSSSFYRNADFMEDTDSFCSLSAKEVAQAIIYSLNLRPGMVVSDITVKPQRHRIIRKK